MDAADIASLQKLDKELPDGRYFDITGKPILFSEWAIRFEDKRYQVIIQEDKGKVLVSTVWLGMDHGWGRSAPIIFETMIFGGYYDQYQERASTLEGALACHIQARRLAFSWRARFLGLLRRRRR